MFNLNDFWHSQFYHFAGTHMVAEIVYEAAYRTLSDSHPVLALLNRLTPQLFSYRQAALATLINKGGYVDNLFAYTGAAAAVTTTILYNEMGAGNFQANYFLRNLENRGLLNSSFGPELKSFPFYEDASAIHTSITKFVSTFVDSYYPTTTSFESDNELQSWISEAIPAQILDFPTSMTRQTLIEIITHIAFLGSAAHQTLNTNDVAEAMAVLPFHPVSLYAPPPTSKGVTDLIPFLPGVAASIGQISRRDACADAAGD
ncbi:putative Epidermis-type lipoxygenase 3 [Glarea lozoyensis 74030]|uniref:Manganese lipoxygenase n=1 Tax=Glarea lozoyensis (strain ATCC 74030 / MF5533) TaxID=1104152 RepID=H0EW42_GLAL7|nr:putative Epidermis-type lipoxygenase 3 [Glarea lozoyensis 74030]